MNLPLLGIGMILYGLYMFYKHDRAIETSATIVDTKPSPCANNGNGGYSCTIDVSYVVNGQTFNMPLDYTGNQQISKGQTISIYYDKINPTHVSLTTAGFSPWYPIGFGVIVLIVVWVNLWLTKKYKPYSAVEGVVGGVNLIESL